MSLSVGAHQGTPVFPGLAVAPVLCLKPITETAVRRVFAGEKEELARLDAALKVSETQIQQIKDMAARTLGENEAMIFEAHLMMLMDPEYLDGIRGEIAGGTIVEEAVRSVTATFVQVLSQASSDYLRERVADLKDISSRLIRNLDPSNHEDLSEDPVILLAEDLAPSDLMAYSRRPLRGVVLTLGGLTSHTAILLKSMGIPAVFHMKDIDLKSFASGLSKPAVLDAKAGRLTLDADPALVEKTLVRIRDEEKMQAALAVWKDKNTILKDGSPFRLCANVANQKQLEEAFERGAEGVGLYRTEFLFMDRSSPPSEKEQTELYKKALATAKGRPVTLRTMDIGGDKEISYLKMPREDNPFLGVRGLRLCLENREIFETQLRALIAASEEGPLEVMFPMVTTLEEVDEVFAILKPLLAKKSPGSPAIKWGMMLEVPSNIFMIPELAERLSFFSVGTNDLTQYLTACDRMNSRLQDLNDPYSLGVLRALSYMASEVMKSGRELSICGEMAADPLLVPFFIGLGVHKLSQNSRMIAASRELLSRRTREECQALARRLVSLGSKSEIREALRAFADA